MFACKSRFGPATRSLIVLDRQTAHPDILLALASPIARPSILRGCKRHHATIASISKGHHLRALREALQSKQELPLNKSKRGGPGKVTIRDARAREINKHHLDIEEDDDGSSLRWSSKVEKSLQIELKWTGGDALKLAQSVLDRLKGRDPQRALELVRASEKMIIAGIHKGVDSVVSWNHIMDYYMSQNSTGDAFRVFNEVRRFRPLLG
jgi:pentatricopeptide repeat protein